MDGPNAAASVFALLQATAEVIGYLKDVKNAPEECQRCQAEACNLRDLLNRLLFHLNQGEDDAWYTSVRELTVKDGPLDQYKQALDQLLSRVDQSSHRQKIKRRLVWKFTKAEVESILQRMERIKSLINHALGTDHLQAIKDDTATTRAALPIIQADSRFIRSTQSEQQINMVLQWLSQRDFPTQHHDIISRKQEGTAQWFLESASFQRWQDGEDTTLFCSGIPGAGKTMIAAVAISHIHRLRQANQNVGLAFAFCNYKATFEQSAPNMLAALLKQLARPQSHIADSVMEMYDKHKSNASRPSVDEWSRALQSICSAYSAIYIIIDALDECSAPRGARDQLIDRVLAIQAGAGIKVRLLCTSRPIPEVTQRFQTVPGFEIRARAEDVRTYVKGQMQTLPDCVWSNKALSVEVEEKIAEAVDGMFLLARLYVESLADMTTPKEVRQRLADLGSDNDSLDQAYKDAMERIDGQPRGRRRLARRAISWITFAQRLLTKEELRHALAIEPGKNALDHDNLSSVKDIVSACAGLVVTDEESSIVRLVHYTTEEFFERQRMAWFPEAQHEIATACLTYLCFDTFWTGACRNREALQERIANNKFLVYSASFWVEHVRSVEQTLDPDLAKHFLGNRVLTEGLLDATPILTGDFSLFDLRYLETSGLHLTAQHGLDVLTGVLLADGRIEADARDDLDRTPLSYAAEKGHQGVVKQLLATGQVEADSSGEYGQTPLSHAAENGYGAVVEILLATGQVEADSSDEADRTPLSYAAEAGHEKVVKILLATDQVRADYEDSENGQTPLSWAAESGHAEVVKILLATGQVEVNSRGVDDRTPLFLAAANGHAEVVEILLGTGQVNPDAKDLLGHTPLSWAAGRGHAEVVEILLATGQVDIYSKDLLGRTPLSWAAGCGHAEVVEILLATGQVNPDAKDPLGRTPLSWAAGCGHAEVVEILLATGQVDIYSKDDFGSTPLYYAAGGGFTEVVELLNRQIAPRPETPSSPDPPSNL